MPWHSSDFINRRKTQRYEIFLLSFYREVKMIYILKFKLQIKTHGMKKIDSLVDVFIKKHVLFLNQFPKLLVSFI